jgi:hypothetical protein
LGRWLFLELLLICDRSGLYLAAAVWAQEGIPWHVLRAVLAYQDSIIGLCLMTAVRAKDSVERYVSVAV